MKTNDSTSITELARRSAASVSVQFDEPGIVPHLVRLLADEGPVSVERLAEAAGIPTERVAAELARHPAVERDEADSIVGFGLTLRPTPHRFTFDGKTVYGWCATDTLIFPLILGRAGVAESTCPLTGEAIRVEVTPTGVRSVEPPDGGRV